MFKRPSHDSEVAQIFAMNIRMLLAATQRNGQEMAYALEVSPSTVSKWMNGHVLPSRTHLEMVSQYFLVTVDRLVEREIFVLDLSRPAQIEIAS